MAKSVTYLVQVSECLSDLGVPSLICPYLIKFFGDCSVWKEAIDGEEFTVVPVLLYQI